MTSVCIVYPCDPVGVGAGGIISFIRGIVRWAPRDLEINVVGVTCDEIERPVGNWIEIDLGRRTCLFFAVAAVDNTRSGTQIPATVRHIWGLITKRPKIAADVLEFHRIEPSIVFLWDRRPKNAFFHQNMQVIRTAKSDIVWKKIPGLYFWLESKLMHTLDSCYTVRQDAVDWYKDNYPDIAERFQFIPTWYDPEIFSPIDDRMRRELKQQLRFDSDTKVLITVGRIDSQKDPLLLADTFKELVGKFRAVHLVYVGDGVLRGKFEMSIAEAGLTEKVTLTGLIPPSEIAELLQAADLFVLSSAYEGMPISVIEALGSGLPVVTTDVGEVDRVVKNNINGEIVKEHTAPALCAAIIRALAQLKSIAGKPCTEAASQYTPARVLAPVYDRYRRLAKESKQV